jgi:hypothetical protein
LYVYLGVAVLVGIIAGLLLYGASAVLNAVFGLDVASNEHPVRSVAEFRAQRRKKRRKRAVATTADTSTPTSTTLVNGKGKGMWSDRGLLSPNTIFEEEESDY